MKNLPAVIALSSFVLLGASLAAEPPGAAQQQEQQLLAAVKEVQAQQLAITENQAKMDEKLATIAEALREARIYVSRAGGGKK